jgi:Brf1-like TBP-binding domain
VVRRRQCPEHVKWSCVASGQCQGCVVAEFHCVAGVHTEGAASAAAPAGEDGAGPSGAPAATGATGDPHSHNPHASHNDRARREPRDKSADGRPQSVEAEGEDGTAGHSAEAADDSLAVQAVPDTLSDIDDDEIDGYIATEEEAAIKGEIWTACNQCVPASLLNHV